MITSPEPEPHRVPTPSVLPVMLACPAQWRTRAAYVVDTFMMALGVSVRYCDRPPQQGSWLLYAEHADTALPLDRCLWVAHSPECWIELQQDRVPQAAAPLSPEGLKVVLLKPVTDPGATASVRFDLFLNAFYFLSSWEERCRGRAPGSRQLFSESVFVKRCVPQDIVDRYLALLQGRLNELHGRLGLPPWPVPAWPGGAQYAVALSHDVDYLPSGRGDILHQGLKSAARHLLRQHDPSSVLRGMAAMLKALVRRQDPFGCVPEILAREAAMGVRSSFQVAVARRHPADVNYRIEDDQTRDYLRAIVDAGFDVCLHGSYRSTEQPGWYEEEVELLARRLTRPKGSRQHFLSFDYDTLFKAQEEAGIQYDMSMGYPDQPGPRAGFSHPYFPYCLAEERPYRVLQISLFIMDVTLRSYLGLKGAAARRAIDELLQSLRASRGCASVVWHPIVFGGARDPGYDELYWQLVETVQTTQGLATDGLSVFKHLRRRADAYSSFVPAAGRLPWH